MFTDLVIAIEERYWRLPNELDSTQSKFNRKRLFVY